MTNKRKVGAEAERIATSFLRAHGYEIEAVNWRKSYEIDIITRKGKALAFVEVKCSRSELFGPPEFRVNKTKRQRLAVAASEYLSELDWEPDEIRFDVISILWPKGKSPDITHIEGAFFLDSD
jgi:putative endonuclease